MNARSQQFLRWLIVWFVCFDVAFLWQKLDGAHESEFGAHPDEAGHYVTGLFVRDAISALPSCVTSGSLAPLAPYKSKEAADGFYQHYPKVALGVWPPGFYVAQSAWTLPFGVSRMSILLLMAALAAGVATLIYRAVFREFGNWPAAAAAFIWLCSPLVRESYDRVMAEMLSALTMFAATLTWGRYLDERRTRDAVFFGLLAAAAILTKGTGLALALMVFFSVAFTRRWKVLAARGTWIGAGLVALLAGPWTWVFRNEGTRVGGWADNAGGFSLEFTQRAVVYYGGKLALALGLAVIVFAVLGFLLRGFTKGDKQGKWAALGALVAGVAVFQIVVPVGYEARHLVSATPALAALAVAGVYCVSRLPRLRVEGAEQTRREWQWVLLLVLVAVPPVIWKIYMEGVEKKGCSGFRPVAEAILGSTQPGTRVLISSDASGEGMFISEVAMRDQRPGLFIERASNVLVDPKTKKWDGRNLHLRFYEDDQLLEYLKESKIEYIVLDDAVPEAKRTEYHDQIKRVINDNLGVFWPMDDMVSPVTRDNEPLVPPIRVYRIMRTRFQ